MSPDMWRVAIVVILGTIMSVLDTTIVNVALDPLSRAFHTSLNNIQWVATAYLLSLAAVIPITGWAARRFGSKRLYLISLVMFTLGSALCGLATSSTELIIFRVIQGVGGGMILPIGQMILVKKAGPRNLARIMSAIGVPVVMAPVIGPTIGGLLIDNAGWRWIFYVNLPVGIAAVIAGLRLLPSDRGEEAGRLDLPGLILIATGLVGVTYGLAEIGSVDKFVDSRVLLPLLAGLILVTCFVVRSLRIERPLLDIRLYRDKAFSAASLTTFCFGAALFGGMILMPLYFQIVRHEDPVYTGLLLAPQGIGTAISMWLSGRLTERLGSGATALMGAIIGTVATIPFVLIGGSTPFVVLSAAMIFRGFGVGMAMMPAMTAAYKVLTPQQINDATPQLNVLQRVGGSIGVALLTVVLQRQLTRAGTNQAAQAAAFGTTFWWVFGVMAVTTLPTLVLLRLERRAAARGDTGNVPTDAVMEAV
jgi:EmrB/QacA subfamily drug resistance transporter